MRVRTFARHPRTAFYGVLAGVGVSLILAFLLPFTRSFFALEFPRPVVVLAAIGIVALTGAAMYGSLRTVGWIRQNPLEDLAELTEEARFAGERAVAWLQDNGFIVNETMTPYMQPYLDAGMVFVPSVDGRTHAEAEFTEWDPAPEGA